MFHLNFIVHPFFLPILSNTHNHIIQIFYALTTPNLSPQFPKIPMVLSLHTRTHYPALFYLTNRTLFLVWPPYLVHIYTLYNFSCNVTNCTIWHVRPKKTQITIGIRAVWSESLLFAGRNAASLGIQNASSEDSDQTARMRRLIWIFAGRTYREVCFVPLRLICCSGYICKKKKNIPFPVNIIKDSIFLTNT